MTAEGLHTQPPSADASHDTVSVVVATRARPALLRTALRSIAEQTYAGPIEMVVVFDQSERDELLPADIPTRDQPGPRSLLLVSNARTPGLAGARNSGVDASSGSLLAFCDDDDSWAPDKLERQVGAMRAAGSGFSVSGIVIHRGDSAITRIPTADDVTVEELSRRRVMEAHPSTVVVTRAAFERIGPVDEQIPGGYAEDYDWMLRACAQEQVTVVPAALVDVLWHPGSFFSTRWRTIIEALDYCVAKHDSIRESPPGLARILGQKAFAYAALGEARQARTWALRALRLNPRERRAYLALLVTLRVVTASKVVEMANARGRGL